MCFKEATISTVLALAEQETIFPRGSDVGTRKQESFGHELSPCRENLSYLTGKGPLEAGNEYEENSIYAVIKRESGVAWEVTSLLTRKYGQEVRSCLTARE